MYYCRYHLSLSLLLLLLMSGCAGGKTQATRYYVIDPVNFDSVVVENNNPLRIEIIDLLIPQYLERFQIAKRVSANRLRFSDSNQWGENLRKNLLRTLARNLSYLLATNDVGTPLNRSASRPDFRLQVFIEKFEQDVDKKVRLVARWQLTVPEQPEPLGIFAIELESDEAISDNNYDEMVSTMRGLYGQLTEKIATTILEQEL